MDIIKAMEQIEKLLVDAEQKLMSGNTSELQHEINNARQIAMGVKMVLKIEGKGE